ncbi:hypothetical protein ACFV80_16200 [Streptomyces sp. NPDC059862]|uniref:hypothetical protein n=1 Tax=Streptomyces sp. NPDC059862 TaxID=3346975 RepID=UPI00365516ED
MRVNDRVVRMAQEQAGRTLRSVKWRAGVVPLIDMLKEAVLRTGCLDAVTSVSGGGTLSAKGLAERLLWGSTPTARTPGSRP